MDLNNSIQLAVRILNNQTDYLFGRNIIDRLFEMTKGEHSKENVARRLSVVDTFYSTNMNRRLFGITDLSEKISGIGPDEIILKEIGKYKEDQKSEIDEILNNDYGIRKTGEDVGGARSLISKYLYFVSNHKFPIEDKLVKNNIKDVLAYFNEPFSKKEDILKSIIKFCSAKRIELEHFDNFIWLIGKINKGSFSLILQKDRYKKIKDVLNINGTSSNDFDKNFADAIRNENKIRDLKDLKLITNDFYNFLMLNIDIRNNTNKGKN